jgi:hypothetical protein
LEQHVKLLLERLDAVAPAPPPPPQPLVTYERTADPLAAPIAFEVTVRPVESFRLLPGQSMRDSASMHDWRAVIREELSAGAGNGVRVFCEDKPIADGTWRNGKLDAPLPRDVIAAIEKAIAEHDLR